MGFDHDKEKVIGKLLRMIEIANITIKEVEKSESYYDLTMVIKNSRKMLLENA